MHSLTVDRRRARLRQRQQIRRRRVVALVAFVTLVSLAIWAAYAVTGATPANIPNTSPLAVNGGQDRSDRVTVASLRGVELLLPVQQEYTTAIAYHSVDNRNALALSPHGDRQSGGGLATRLADVFKSGGGVRYYLMDGGGGASSATAGLDVGAAPGSYIYSPIDGYVTGVKTYSLLGRYTDQEVDIRFDGDPSLLLVVTHVTDVSIKIGDQVRAGETQIGCLRAFPTQVDQSLKQFTSDAGDHVQIMVLHVPVSIAGF